MMAAQPAFQPNWASPPGDTIAAILSERDLSIPQFAEDLGLEDVVVRKILSGEREVDAMIAQRLAQVLDTSASFWIRRESQYRENLFSLKMHSNNAASERWLKAMPIADMTKFGWIRSGRTSQERLTACLEFFGVADIGHWSRRYRQYVAVASFRTSPTFESNPAAVAAWLRWGELKSERIPCASWDPHRFRSNLDRIRTLIRKREPSTFFPELRDLCAKSGVALVIARSPGGCRASGATRFLSPEKAMLILSFRYLSEDHFWFTFFHEAGHLLLHSKEALFLEDESETTSLEEAEANEFAANFLISSERVPALMKLRLEMKEIVRFARSAGVTPGIVVGQLQYRGRLAHNRLNGFKRRFMWTKIDALDSSPE